MIDQTAIAVIEAVLGPSSTSVRSPELAATVAAEQRRLIKTNVIRALAGCKSGRCGHRAGPEVRKAWLQSYLRRRIQADPAVMAAKLFLEAVPMDPTEAVGHLRSLLDHLDII